MSTSLCLLTYIGDYTRQSTCRSFRAHYVLRVDTVPKRNEYQKYYLGGKGGRCVRLTTLPPSCADFLEIWEPQPPGTLGAFQGCSGKSLHLPNAHNQVCSDMTNSDVQAEVRAFAKTDCPKFTIILQLLFLPLPSSSGNRDSVVGIATRYGLEGPVIESR